jgi:hypothetical protein
MRARVEIVRALIDCPHPPELCIAFGSDRPHDLCLNCGASRHVGRGDSVFWLRSKLVEELAKHDGDTARYGHGSPWDRRAIAERHASTPRGSLLSGSEIAGVLLVLLFLLACVFAQWIRR